MSNGTVTIQEVMDASNSFWKKFSPITPEQLEKLKNHHHNQIQNAATSELASQALPEMVLVLNAWTIRDTISKIGQIDSIIREQAESKDFGVAEMNELYSHMQYYTTALANYLFRVFNPQLKQEMAEVSENLVRQTMADFINAGTNYSKDAHGDFMDYTLKIIVPHLPEEYVNGLLKLETEFAGTHPDKAPKTVVSAAVSELVGGLQRPDSAMAARV